MTFDPSTQEVETKHRISVYLLPSGSTWWVLEEPELYNATLSPKYHIYLFCMCIPDTYVKVRGASSLSTVSPRDWNRLGLISSQVPLLSHMSSSVCVHACVCVCTRVCMCASVLAFIPTSNSSKCAQPSSCRKVGSPLCFNKAVSACWDWICLISFLIVITQLAVALMSHGYVQNCCPISN